MQKQHPWLTLSAIEHVKDKNVVVIREVAADQVDCKLYLCKQFVIAEAPITVLPWLEFNPH